MKIAIIVLWVIWALLFLAWPSDMLVVFLREPGELSKPDSNFVRILGFVGFFGLCFTFFLKWFLLRFIVSPKRVRVSSPWAIVILVAASLMIWGLTKSVEIYGLIIFFGSESFPHYLAFWIPSILVMLIHAPYFLDPRRVIKNHAEQSDAANPRPCGTSGMPPANSASRAGDTPEASGGR